MVVLQTWVWRVGRIKLADFWEIRTSNTHSQWKYQERWSCKNPKMEEKKKIKLVIHKRTVCASDQEVLGAFLIHSREKTWSLLSKWSTLSFSHLPFHLNSLFIRSHPVPQNKTNPKSHLPEFISSLPWENLLCWLWDLFYFSGVCQRVKLQLERGEIRQTGKYTDDK